MSKKPLTTAHIYDILFSSGKNRPTKCLIKRGFSESGGLVPTKPGNLSESGWLTPHG